MYKIEYLFKEPAYQPAFATGMIVFIGCVFLILVISKTLSVEYFPGYRAKAVGKILLWIVSIFTFCGSMQYYDMKLWVKPYYTKVIATLDSSSLYDSIYPPAVCGRYKLDDGSNRYIDPCVLENVNYNYNKDKETITLYKIEYKQNDRVRWFPWSKEYEQ